MTDSVDFSRTSSSVPRARESGDAELANWLSSRPVDPAVRHALRPGDAVGEWRVEAFVGAGRSAEVYRVVDSRTGADGALKLLVDESLGLKERFLAERDAIRFFPSGVLPRFYSAGTCGGRLYYVMEYLLPLLLPMKDADVPPFMAKVASAVARLHAAGFVHRDLKPGNILMRADGEPVLIDLGLAKRLPRAGAGPDPGAGGKGRRDLSQLGGAAVGVGTVDFAAPEQLLKGECSEASDVYALGKTMRACYAGNPPRGALAVILRATREAPGDRYATAAAMAAALRRMNHRGRRIAGEVAVVVAAAFAVAAVCWSAAREPSAPPPAPVSPPPAAPSQSLSIGPNETESEHLVRLLSVAEGGDAEAQMLVAEAYFHGRGTDTNFEESVRWYTLAARQGAAGAQASLGLCALRGWGCAVDHEAAARWLALAAEQGNLGAMNDLAFCYMNGYGVERDAETGFRWAMKAAERGHPAAQTMVGECYLDGRGVSSSQERADVWLQRAARQGNARAQMLLRTR